VRKVIIALLALSAIMAFVSQPVMALPLMSVPFVSTASGNGLCGMTFAWPYAECGYLVTEFNNTKLALFDTEQFALSFTPEAGDTFIDESIGSPVIAQTSGQRAVYDRTYFFADTSTFI
jgi:hypothetical protein